MNQTTFRTAKISLQNEAKKKRRKISSHFQINEKTSAELSRIAINQLIMLELDIIAAVEWNQEIGTRLKAMRGKVSRRALAVIVQSEYGYKVSQQYIQLLEHPAMNEKAPSTVSFKLLRYLTQALGRDVYELFNSPKIFASHT